MSLQVQADRSKFCSFRWVECQFKSLQSCPRSEAHLDHLLGSFPQSLDETYERMLCNINPSLVEDAKRILTLLCFASRPLTVREVIEGIAVEIDAAGINLKRRLHDADDIHEICLGLVEIDIAATSSTPISGPRITDQTVRIAHFSVQEYLESERIQHHKAAHFSLNGGRAHAEIALICLRYLQDPGLLRTELDHAVVEQYPLAPFAAEYWYHHYKHAEGHTPKLDDVIFDLFQHKGSFLSWIKLYDPHECIGISPFAPSERVAGPLYYAALLGLHQVLKLLLVAIERHKNFTKQDPSVTAVPKFAWINPTGGSHDHALLMAPAQGYEKKIQPMSEYDSSFNAQGGFFGNDVSARGGYCGNALLAASSCGREKIIKLLLENDVDEFRGDALWAASCNGHENAVHLLLEHGSEVIAQKNLDTALCVASERGHEGIVKLLIEKGADVNALRGNDYNALQLASVCRQERIVKLLIDNGAIVDNSAQFGSALRTASADGQWRIVELLIEKGFDVDARQGDGPTALQEASLCGDEKTVNFLIEKGADVNAHGTLGTALHYASHRGYERIVKSLIESGANVDISGNYSTALVWASSFGHERVVELLIEKGADVNACGENLPALQRAAKSVNEKTVDFLIKKGADVNARGSALMWALKEGHARIAEVLIEKGADVNARGPDNETPLQWASREGYEDKVQLLLRHGAKENIKDHSLPTATFQD